MSSPLMRLLLLVPLGGRWMDAALGSGFCSIFKGRG